MTTVLIPIKKMFVKKKSKKIEEEIRDTEKNRDLA